MTTTLQPDLRAAATEVVREVIAEVKPRLRGGLHLATIPLLLAAGLALIGLSPTSNTRTGSAIFIVSALAMFTVSAIYARGERNPRTRAVLRRVDHANIFLLIAGSSTAYCLLLLQGKERAVLLLVVWIGAFLGGLFGLWWINSPRWLHTPIYVALGGAGFLFTPGFLDGASRLDTGIGAVTLILLSIGGALYVPRRSCVRIPEAQSVASRGRLSRGVSHADDPGLRELTSAASGWRRCRCVDPRWSLGDSNP